MIEKQRREHGAEHPDVKLFDEYRQRYSVKSTRNANTKRFCSYCRDDGHNIRTCKKKLSDISKLKKANHQWRQSILNDLRQNNIGIGSIMVNHNSVTTLENPDSPWILTNVEWKSLSWITDNKKCFRMVLMKNPAITKFLTVEQILNQSSTYYHRWRVISNSTELDFPDGWDSISDPEFDEVCVDLFSNLSKDDYDILFISRLEKCPIRNIKVNFGEKR